VDGGRGSSTPCGRQHKKLKLGLADVINGWPLGKVNTGKMKCHSQAWRKRDGGADHYCNDKASFKGN